MSDGAATSATLVTPVTPRGGAVAAFVFRPLLAPLLATRKAAVGLAALGAAQIVATSFHLPGWPCPLFHATGIPCPGCGLSRASAALLHGDIDHSLRMHAFALPVLLGVLVVLVTAVLPAVPRAKVLVAVERIERRTGLATLLLIALLVYWLARLVYAPQAFISLIAHH
jgi:hypothetical protein